MIRVYHIVASYGLGGAAAVAKNISVSKSEDIEYHLIEVIRCNSEFSRQFSNELREKGVHIHRSPISVFIHFHYVFEKLSAILFPFWAIFVLKRKQPDIIHSHTEIPDFATYCLFKTFGHSVRKCRVVRTIHNNSLWNKSDLIGGWIEKFMQRHQIVAISDSTYESYFRKYHFRPQNLIYNGIEKVEPKSFLDIKKGKINVLFAGRFEIYKGVRILVKLIQELANDNRYFFHIIGDGSMKKEIITALNTVESVQILPPFNGIAAYLNSFDYLIMPSEFEGLSILSLEASFQQLPCIINDCCGLSETLPDNWPLKVHNNDLKEYLHIFRDILPSLNKKELCLSAYAFAECNFSLSNMQNAYEDLYRSLLGDTIV